MGGRINGWKGTIKLECVACEMKEVVDESSR